MSDQTPDQVVIVGAGPAGLTAAYELCKAGRRAVVLEKDQVVGGISRTVHYNGYHFDIGGHRFFTKVRAVEDFWHEVLPEGDFLTRSRLSRILYNKKFFNYPLRATNALLGLGVINSVLVMLSYIKARLLPVRNERTFADWVSNRFGKRLYSIFFKTYTEKVWGIPCDQLSAEWAAQRIKGLSLVSALKNALLPPKNENKADVIKTLIDSFQYPKRGPGMMWETVTEKVRQQGSEVRLGSNVEKVCWSGDKIRAVEVATANGTQRVEGSHFISTMPVRELIQKCDPAPPPEIVAAANILSYRDFLTVALIVNKPDLFPDNWIYIHDTDVKVGRIQNFKNWSPFMVPDPAKSCIGLEYFCFEGDGLWTMSDEELVELGKREMDALGLVDARDVEDGAVVRMPKAYPVYDDKYGEALVAVRGFLSRFDNIHLVGRNGMHKYNNQDHSMLTAMLAVENIQGAKHDVWSVNVDQEYHEEVTRAERDRRAELAALEATQPRVPVAEPALDPATVAILKIFARLHKGAFGGALGLVCGLYILAGTLWIVATGGQGGQVSLLGQYFYGFTVSVKGAFVGFLYGCFWGFMFGWGVAYVRNLAIGVYVAWVKRRAEVEGLRDYLSHI